MKILILTPSSLEKKVWKNKTNLKNTELVVLETGIGKLNCIINLFDYFSKHENNFDLVIGTGITGINADIGKIGDICLADAIFDIDINYLFDDLSREKLNIIVNNLMVKIDYMLREKVKFFAENYAQKQGLNLIEGLFVSGDNLFHGKKCKENIGKLVYAQTNRTYIATDMESLAIARFCEYKKLPFIIIKAGSNYDIKPDCIEDKQELYNVLNTDTAEKTSELICEFVYDFILKTFI